MVYDRLYQVKVYISDTVYTLATAQFINRVVFDFGTVYISCSKEKTLHVKPNLVPQLSK